MPLCFWLFFYFLDALRRRDTGWVNKIDKLPGELDHGLREGSLNEQSVGSHSEAAHRHRRTEMGS